jgi:hypothetical protein
MKSLAIVRATDILKLKSTLLEMNRSGLEFEGQPKEINPASVQKTLSKVSKKNDKNYEVCALIPIVQDIEISLGKIKSIPLYCDVVLMDASHELFEQFFKLMPVLPDLDIPALHMDGIKSEAKGSASTVYLGVFVNRKVQVETNSGSMQVGVLKHADPIGVFLEPPDNSSPLFITWHEIRKIIIPKENRK